MSSLARRIQQKGAKIGVHNDAKKPLRVMPRGSRRGTAKRKVHPVMRLKDSPIVRETAEQRKARLAKRRAYQRDGGMGFLPRSNKRIDAAIQAAQLMLAAAKPHLSAVEIQQEAVNQVAKQLPAARGSRYRIRPSKNDSPAYRKTLPPDPVVEAAGKPKRVRKPKATTDAPAKSKAPRKPRAKKVAEA